MVSDRQETYKDAKRILSHAMTYLWVTRGLTGPDVYGKASILDPRNFGENTASAEASAYLWLEEIQRIVERLDDQTRGIRTHRHRNSRKRPCERCEQLYQLRKEVA